MTAVLASKRFGALVMPEVHEKAVLDMRPSLVAFENR